MGLWEQRLGYRRATADNTGGHLDDVPNVIDDVLACHARSHGQLLNWVPAWLDKIM